MSKIRIKFWGVRGSMASPGPKTVGTGGNTSCLEIDVGGEIIICDAGTGIRPLGLDLMRRAKGGPIAAHIILSHMHWDHYIGLPFFRPLYSGANRFTIAGPKAGGARFKTAITRVVNPPYFPIPFSRVPAKIKFKTISPGGFKLGRVRVEAFELNHPGGSLGWRFFFPNGTSLVHVTDNEPVSGERLKRFIGWMRGADVLIHDSQFGPRSYKHHAGWGHSPFTYSLLLAKEADAGRLFLFHFDPGDDDRHMSGVIKQARSLMRRSGSKFRCDLAREGMSFTL